jgi:hypothetical protein
VKIGIAENLKLLLLLQAHEIEPPLLRYRVESPFAPFQKLARERIDDLDLWDHVRERNFLFLPR